MVAIHRLNHAVLFVRSLDRALAFYRDVLGFEVVSREPRMNAAFLRAAASRNHHDLGLFGVGEDAPPKRRGVGLYHLAWQVDTIDELADAQRALAEAGALGGQSHHGATVSLYGSDPDGNEFEIQWMLPRDAWGEYETRAVVRPLDLAREVERWSGVSTAHELAAPTTSG